MKYFIDNNDSILYSLEYALNTTILIPEVQSYPTSKTKIPDTSLVIDRNGIIKIIYIKDNTVLHTLTPAHLKLLPCPFCNNKAYYDKTDYDDDLYTVRCSNHMCFCEATYDYGLSMQEIAAKWNKRS